MRWNSTAAAAADPGSVRGAFAAPRRDIARQHARRNLLIYERIRDNSLEVVKIN
jgi:hypothetical protein